MTDRFFSRITPAHNLAVKRWANHLPVIAASALLLAVGVGGWLGTSDVLRERERSIFLLDANRFADDVKQALLDAGKALEQDIANSRLQTDQIWSIDWEGLTRRINNNTRLSDLGQVGLAAPTAARQNSPPDSHLLAVSKSTLTEHQLDSSITAHHSAGWESNTDTGYLGQNLFATADTYGNLLRARDSGHAVLHLTSDQSSSAAQNSAWLYAPVYGIDTPWSMQDRRSQFKGLVFASIDLGGLASRMAEAYPGMSATVVNDDASDSKVATRTPKDNSPAVRNHWIGSRDVLGQRIQLEVIPTVARSSASVTNTPILFMVQGCMATLLLLWVFMHHTRIFQASLRELTRVNAERSARITELERKNADLESFAYVVSHDLKAPLYKMQALTDVLEEELKLSTDETTVLDDLDECLCRMRVQSTKMESLINGVLDYSSLVSQQEAVESIDSRMTIESVATSLGLPSKHIHMVGDFPTIRTWAVRFEQVMANLIGNAFKYHDRPDEARIEVCVSGFGDYHLFAVRDNGRGIDPSQHDKIFDVFQSVKVPGVESSGVGLSIVRNAVENAGGRITLDSSPGAGSVFSFTWPKDMDDRQAAAQVAA